MTLRWDAHDNLTPRWTRRLQRKAGPARTASRGLVCGVLLGLAACSSQAPKPPPMLNLAVDAQSTANGGQLFYFLIRTVNEKQFVLDSYQEVAKRAFADPPDASVIGVYPVIPGESQEIELPKPNQGQTALYFLFTQPGTNWKKLLAEPLADDYQIALPAGNQLILTAGKAWWERLWPF